VTYVVDPSAYLVGDVGLGFGIGGSLIHMVLVVALIVLVINVLQGRRVA
jgi:hypothetical protein